MWCHDVECGGQFGLCSSLAVKNGSPRIQLVLKFAHTAIITNFMISRIDLANIGEMANAINDPDLYRDLYVQLHRRVRWMESIGFNAMAVLFIIALGLGLFSSFFLPKKSGRRHWRRHGCCK